MNSVGVPEVSIIVPAFNAESFIGETLRSILEQTEESWECIVVDDGSEDRTSLIVQSFLYDPRIRLIQIEENSGGPAVPRNLGINSARGDYIAIFDADDLMLKEKIRIAVSLLNKYTAAEFLFTDFQVIDESGFVVEESFLSNYDTLHGLQSKKISSNANLISAKELQRGLSKANFIGTSSVVMRKRLFNDFVKFDERLNNGEDYLLWSQLSKCYDAIYVDEPMHQYRRHGKSISNSNTLKRLENRAKLHSIIIGDEHLPPYFRKKSKRKMVRCYEELIELLLVNGDFEKAKFETRESISKGCFSFRLLALQLIAFLPNVVTRYVVSIARKIFMSKRSDVSSG